MKLSGYHMVASVLTLYLAGALCAQQPASYGRQVKPFLARYCFECHNAATLKGELDLESFKALMQGGKNGPVVVPGKPDESRLVLMVEHKVKPVMPPAKAKQPQPAELAVLRAWVAAGAKDDSASATVVLPSIRPRGKPSLPVTALAYAPDGKSLIAGVHRDIVAVDVSTFSVKARLADQPGKVTAAAFSRDGLKLATGNSVQGTSGVVRLYGIHNGIPTAAPMREWRGHEDAILDLAFSPDGKLLATTGYDRLVKLWENETGRLVRTLKDHSDTVYGLAFSPDGKFLASAAADRAVKIWNVATGVRLYSLGEATDWLYAVAWSPDGRHVAAAGVDKSIRVWEAQESGGKIVHSVFAHEAAIQRLSYATDGKTLYSLSEDRVLKAWDTAGMVERNVFAAQPALALTLAIRPDHRQLALGRFDGALVMIEEASGKVQGQPLPEKPKPPQLKAVTPGEGPRGKALRVELTGDFLEHAAVVVAAPGAMAKVLERKPTKLTAEIIFPPSTPAGTYQLSVKNSAGQSGQLPFKLDLFPVTPTAGRRDTARTGQRLQVPAAAAGVIERAGQVDYFRLELRAGQELGVQAVTSPHGSKLDPFLQLQTDDGAVAAESGAGVLAFKCPKAGWYVLSIRDKDFRGGNDMHYRLQAGDVPVIASVFPMGVQRGRQSKVELDGVNLGPETTALVNVAADAAVNSRAAIPVGSLRGRPLGDETVLVGEFPEVIESPDGTAPVVPVPGTANGRITEPGASRSWRFSASKGMPLIIEVNARRLGSPLDSAVDVLDRAGRPVPSATLRCVAKTYVTFRDHDSANTGIRIETWSELAMNDFIWVGNELLRIKDLPKNPDDDCQFISSGGQRLGFLGTTPTHLSMGLPMYKVTIHPPGTQFAPNGFPIIHLTYRNDDGGPGLGKDSRLTFVPPADGEYQIRVSDARGKGSRSHAYRLTIRPARPSFQVSFNPTEPSVWQDGAVPISVTAERIDGFDGAIDVRLENLPAGFRAPATTIPAGENSTSFALHAEPGTKTPAAGTPPFRLLARASINGQMVVRELKAGLPRIVPGGELATATEQSEIQVQPGQQVWMTARIDRRNGFKGRVPLEVRGLPHGVRVLDIGLNGILITEKETSRAFAIYAEPWVKPISHPFVVLAKNEKKGTEHAARSVILHVKAAK